MCAKMLFASYGFESPIMQEKFLKEIIKDELYNKSCLVLPYAAPNAEKAFDAERRDLVAFGFSESKIKLVRCKDDILNTNPDYIYVPGGNTFKLLKYLKDNVLIDCIVDCVKNKHTVYIGISAGADIACENIEYVVQLEDNNVINDNFDALGLIPVALLCHYDYYSYAKLKACEQKSNKSIITINNDQLLVYENKNWRYVGE
ncbi:MAG: Type 1 glutamine amidotransferase-like domain-containing protein [Clostridia bacterium]|nr:Type 1 glutamine amidotransferase-like domain-containing protein [Clostridia bacterium]